MSRPPAFIQAVLFFVLATLCGSFLRHVRDDSSLLESNQSDDHVLSRFLQAVDPIVLQRYLQRPAGFRHHPYYYSDSYYRRGRELSAGAVANLTAEWGAWNFVDDKLATRPGNDFYAQFPNRDVPRASFPATAWQIDATYLARWLPEAISLTKRTMEAILTEYGRGEKDMPGVNFTDRAAKFRFSVGEAVPGGKGPLHNGGWTNQRSLDGLRRRVLHAIMTEDSFNIAMGGHSAAAGHGNLFQQSYTIQIGRILEPVMARLGVKATARNFGMGGLGTLQNGLAAGDIYGRDVDILMWDSSMTENNPNPVGIFGVQGLLGSDRAPLLWFWSNIGNLLGEFSTSVGADVAMYGDGTTLPAPVLSDPAEVELRPYAVRYTNCAPALAKFCAGYKYFAGCWVDRTNFTWAGMDLAGPPPPKQAGATPGRAGWHPGFRAHQRQGRALTFPILEAIHDVLTKWNATPGYVLPDEDWHVSSHYDAIRTKVANMTNYENWCAAMRVPLGFCKFRANGRTENGARTRPWETSIRSLMGQKSGTTLLNATPSFYDPPDPPSPYLFPPEGQVDVLAIIENGVPYARNLARVRDSAESMTPPVFTDAPVGSNKNLSITGGKGWTKNIYAGSDMCDGEHDSTCDRTATNTCMGSGHNDHRNGLLFDGFSGWGIFDLPNVTHGTIVIKLHSWWFFPISGTVGWCSENNALPCQGRNLEDTQDMRNSVHRQLKPPVPHYCEEFMFDFAINGNVKTWNLTEWRANTRAPERVVELWTLLDDPSFNGGVPTDVELAIRMRGCGRQKPFELTHIYWI